MCPFLLEISFSCLWVMFLPSISHNFYYIPDVYKRMVSQAYFLPECLHSILYQAAWVRGLVSNQELAGFPLELASFTPSSDVLKFMSWPVLFFLPAPYSSRTLVSMCGKAADFPPSFTPIPTSPPKHHVESHGGKISHAFQTSGSGPFCWPTPVSAS